MGSAPSRNDTKNRASVRRPDPRQLRLIILSSVLLVFVGVLLLGAYRTVASPSCASCHKGATFVRATRVSPHSKVACASCHIGKGAVDRLVFGVHQATGVIAPLTGDTGREAAAVPDSRCISCHKSVKRTVVTSTNGLRIAHSTCAVGSSCTDCHSSTAHGEATSWVRTYDMEKCLSCHAAKASTACDLCHDGKRPADRVTTGVFATTHGPQWRTTHGMGKSSTCAVCHTVATCGKCHGPGLPHDELFVNDHSKIARRPDAKCSTCHEKAFCTDCHGVEMPHPKAFVRQHPSQPASVRASCNRCHAPADCSTCHEKHVHPGGATATGVGG